LRELLLLAADVGHPPAGLFPEPGLRDPRHVTLPK
jgi:hypothetical protein